MGLTLIVTDPCKKKKCLVKACCTEQCELKTYYLKFCDGNGNIIFQRFCVITTISGVISLIYALFQF
jgi:hypothetical protein